MKNSIIITSLAERVGREFIAVRSPYHVQFETAPQVVHDLWFSSDGLLKWRLHGKRAVAIGTLGELLREIDLFRPETTDLAEMRGAIELSRSIREASQWMRSISLTGPGMESGGAKLTHAIFCDAGFKEGRARISLVAILGETVDAHSEMVQAIGSNEAERLAILCALNRYSEGNRADVPIFSDSAGAVKGFRVQGHTRVQWISRKQNGAADRLANLRGG